MHEAGHSELVHWDDPEGWDEEGGGREGQDGEHMYTHGWFMSMYGKNHHNIVISLQLKKKLPPKYAHIQNGQVFLQFLIFISLIFLK